MQARSFSSVASAASTAATERGRPAESGMTVPGKSVVCCKGSTAISKTSPPPFAAAGSVSAGSTSPGSKGFAASSAPCAGGVCSFTSCDGCPLASCDGCRPARTLDGTGEAYGLLEAAVGDFELVVGDRLAERLVASAARDAQRVARDANLQLVGHDAGQLQLDDPAVARPVHVRRRVPELLSA